MKVQNIVVKGLLAATFVAGLSGCNSFLDEYNPSNQTVTFFETKEGFETEINGAYSELRAVYNQKNYLGLTWLGTDLFTQPNNTGLNNLNQYTINLDNREGAVSGWWNSLYRALMSVNSAIDYGGKVQGMDAALLKRRMAEMKGLRALFLFEIVRNWGDAPLMNYVVTAPEYTGRRDPAADIYAQILADLEEAVAVLPASYAGNDFGRFSSSAARHLRALVYLTRGYNGALAESTDFANAYADATAVVDGSDHSLLPDYGQVHRYDNETNAEIIFSVQFSTDAISGKGNSLGRFLIFPYREGYTGGSKSEVYGNDDGSFMPTKYAYMLFDWVKDKRAQVTFMSAFNGDPATSVDGLSTGHNWMQVTQAVANTYDVGDASFLFPTPAYSATPDASLIKEKTQTIPYPTGDPNDFSPNGVGNAYWTVGGTPETSLNTRTWLPVWKFRDNNVEYLENNASTGTRDTYLFRVGETCLIAAEAALKNGDNAGALKYLNMVRSRAEINAGDLVYPGGTTVTIDMILDERALELFGESSRWNDLQRTGKLVERVRAHNWDVNNLSTGSTQLTEGSTKFYLRPIPLAWIQSLRNYDEITNNPGWE